MKTLKEYLKEDYSYNPLHDLTLRPVKSEQDIISEFLKGMKVALESELDADRVYDDLKQMAYGLPEGEMKQEAFKILDHIRGEEIEHIALESNFIKKHETPFYKKFYKDGEDELNGLKNE